MRDSVVRRDSGESDGVMPGVYGVRHDDGFGLGIYGLLAAIVIKGDTSD